MSFEVPTAFVQQYKANLTHLLQQKGSVLRDTVTVESQNAEFAFYDRIGSTEANEVNTRHGDTPLNNTPHDRRRIGLRDFDWADLIDRPDRIRLLVDPTGPYTVNAMWALGRKMDDVIIQRATGSAWTGKTGSVEVTFPTSTQQIAVNYVESGGAANSNLTVGKLRRCLEIFQANEVGDDMEKIVVVTSNQLHAMLIQTPIISSDYNTVRALAEGRVDTFMGFRFRRCERLAKSGNNRSVLVYTKDAITMAMGEDITVDVGPRRDKRNATQIYVCATLDATRMEEKKVVEILCDESTFPTS